MDHYAGGKRSYYDPHQHPTAFTTRFLSRLLEADGDIRVAMHADGIHVDWWQVEKDGKGKGTSKGSRPDGKGSGKRPQPDAGQQRTTRQRRI